MKLESCVFAVGLLLLWYDQVWDFLLMASCRYPNFSDFRTFEEQIPYGRLPTVINAQAELARGFEAWMGAKKSASLSPLSPPLLPEDSWTLQDGVTKLRKSCK